MEEGIEGTTAKFLKIISTLESTDDKLSDGSSKAENKHILIALIGTISFLILNILLNSFIASLFFGFGLILCAIPLLKVLFGWIRELQEQRKENIGESTLATRAKFQTAKIEAHVKALAEINIDELKSFKDWLSESIKYDTGIIAIFAAIVALLPKAAEILSLAISGLMKANPDLNTISFGLDAGANIAILILVVTTLVVKTSLPTYARYLFYINFTINHGYDRKTKDIKG